MMCCRLRPGRYAKYPPPHAKEVNCRKIDINHCKFLTMRQPYPHQHKNEGENQTSNIVQDEEENSDVQEL